MLEENIKNELAEFMVSAGKRLLTEQGKIADIGVKKHWVTEEDVRIERDIKQIVNKFKGKQEFFAEEENDKFVTSDSVWIVDPISGTKIFIEGGELCHSCQPYGKRQGGLCIGLQP